MLLLCSCNYRVYVIGKKFEDQANLTEKWYGTKYSIEQIPEEQIKVECDHNYIIYFIIINKIVYLINTIL